MAVVATASGATPHLLNGFLAVQVEMLRRFDSAVVDLFVQPDPHGPPVLYQLAGGPLDEEHANRFADGEVQRYYVRLEDFALLGSKVLESVESLAGNETVPSSERFAALQMALAGEIERTAHTIDCGAYVALSARIGKELVALFAGGKALPSDLFRLARHDFNTFTHVTNVASYSIILAERLGINDHGELELIAAGAMLHDIGKRFIPASVLAKPSKLDDRERAVIETHPQRGYEELCQRPDVTFEQLMMTYQHHERMDGTGYPVGLAGNEIHPWARMLAVVDVFDAMTGTRPYRRPATVQSAMDYLKLNAGTHFDPEVVQCWDAAMSDS